MQNDTEFLKKYFNIDMLTKIFISKKMVEKYYKESLEREQKRTRADSKISALQMVLYLILWIVHPEDGYAASIDKSKIFSLKSIKQKTNKCINAITPAGLCKARKRFTAIILKKLWQQDVIDAFTEQNPVHLWNSFQVSACDATSITLPNEPDIIKDYPLGKNDKKPRMLMAVIYDVFSKIPLLCECASPLISHERALLYAMLPSVSKTMLLVLDRGYQAYWLFDAFMKNSIQFICRVKNDFNYKIVRKISKNEWIISINLSSAQRYSAKKYIPLDAVNSLSKTIILRLIKTQIKGFRPRLIVTSLLDSQKYSYDDIADLYCKRWRIESYFRDLKHLFKIEKFHAKYLDGIFQELYAAMIVSVIIRFFMRESSETHSVEFDEISFKNSVFLFSIFLYIFDYDNNSYNIFISLISLNKNKIRNDRHFPRIFYKRILKKVVL